MSNGSQNPGAYSNAEHFKQSEALMLQVQLERRALLQAIPDMVFVMSPEGDYLDFKLDKERHLTEDLIGRNIRELSFMPLAVAQDILKKLEQTIITGQTQSLEYQIDDKVNYRAFVSHYEAYFSLIDSEKILMG
jgi:hypothetical protein